MKSICGVKIEDIITIGIAEDDSVFKIEFACLNDYLTLEKAEQYFYDLAYKIDHSSQVDEAPVEFRVCLNWR